MTFTSTFTFCQIDIYILVNRQLRRNLQSTLDGSKPTFTWVILLLGAPGLLLLLPAPRLLRHACLPVLVLPEAKYSKFRNKKSSSKCRLRSSRLCHSKSSISHAKSRHVHVAVRIAVGSFIKTLLRAGTSSSWNRDLSQSYKSILHCY